MICRQAVTGNRNSAGGYSHDSGLDKLLSCSIIDCTCLVGSNHCFVCYKCFRWRKLVEVRTKPLICSVSLSWHPCLQATHLVFSIHNPNSTDPRMRAWSLSTMVHVHQAGHSHCGWIPGCARDTLLHAIPFMAVCTLKWQTRRQQSSVRGISLFVEQ